MNSTTIDYHRHRAAELAIGHSTLRNQGAPGVAEAARRFLAGVKLRRFSVDAEQAFVDVLDGTTDNLAQALPAGAQSWGAARKAVNIFLRDCVYDRFLCEHFGLAPIHRWLELPLDSFAAKGLRNTSRGGHLPRWDAIKRLTKDQSAAYQKVASEIAACLGCNRVDLDIYLWREIGIGDIERV